MGNNENKYFWLFQFIGWSLVGGLNLIVQKFNDIPTSLIVFNVIGLSFGGFLISSGYRSYLKKMNWISWKKGKLIGFIFISVIVLSVIWLLLLFLIISLIGTEISFISFMANLIPIGMLLLIWFLFYFGYHLIKHYHLSEIERWKLKSEVQSAQLDILKLQINPHFLFNTLNNIRALILEDQHRARQMLTNFSDLFRYSLLYTENKEVFLPDELKIVNQFLELAKIQYEEKLEYQITCVKNLNNETIPPMVIQILVENAIKHGIALSNEKKNLIFISVDKTKNILHIQVKNTGSLYNRNQLETSLGLGLKNIKERLQFLYDKNATFNLSSNGQFVEANIKIHRK